MVFMYLRLLVPNLAPCAVAATPLLPAAFAAAARSLFLDNTSLQTAVSITITAGHAQAANASLLASAITGRFTLLFFQPLFCDDFAQFCSQLHFQIQRRRLSLQRMPRSVLRPAVFTMQRFAPHHPFNPFPTSFTSSRRVADPLSGSYITAGASKMHLQCFTCHACSRPICDKDNSSPYYEKDGNFYCRNDYIRLFMPVCAVRILLCPSPPLPHRMSHYCRCAAPPSPPSTRATTGAK